MNSPKLDLLLNYGYQVCVLGEQNSEVRAQLWSLIEEITNEQKTKIEKAKKNIAEKRKADPNYAQSFIDGKRKQYYKKKSEQ